MNKFVKRLLIIAGAVLAIAGAAFICFVYKVEEPPSPKLNTMQDTKNKKIKVACIGDSITYGAGVLSTREEDSYPAILQEVLGEGYQVLNYGLSGRTLLKKGNRPYQKEAFFQESQEVQPDIVLIMLGTNDSKPLNWDAKAYEAELRDFVRLYQNISSHPKVYLMTCCDAFVMDGKEEAAFHVDKTVIENELAGIIKKVGELCEVPVIDVFGGTKGHSEYFVDGVHPNAEGNQVIAEMVYNGIM